MSTATLISVQAAQLIWFAPSRTIRADIRLKGFFRTIFVPLRSATSYEGLPRTSPTQVPSTNTSDKMGILIQFFLVTPSQGAAMRHAINRNANLIPQARTGSLPDNLAPSQMLLVTPSDPVRHGFCGLAVFLYEALNPFVRSPIPIVVNTLRYMDVLHGQSDALVHDTNLWVSRGWIREMIGLPMDTGRGLGLEQLVAEYVRSLREEENEQGVMTKIFVVATYWTMATMTI